MTPKFPLTDHLWQIGFRLSFQVHRLTIPLDDGMGNVFNSRCELTAYPERGEARRLFANNGPARAEVHSNLKLELFQYEREQGKTDLKERYTEACARLLFDLLRQQAPHVSKPKASIDGGMPLTAGVPV